MAAELGSVKGIGPAAVGMYSPDWVGLVGRVWLHDAETGEEHGPRRPPTRAAVASAVLAWTPDNQLLTNALLALQGRTSRRVHP